MINYNKNKQIGFVLKSLFLYYFEQKSSDDVYVPYEEYLLYQLKLADVTGILTREEIYEVIQTYEEMVNNSNLVEKAEYDYEGKYYRLYNLLDNSEYSLFDDLRNTQGIESNCQYGDICYFLVGKMSADKYKIYFDVARASRHINKLTALDIYLPFKSEQVIRNEQLIMEADFGSDSSINTFSRNSLRAISWYLGTHKSDNDFNLLFSQFKRGENFEGIKETQVDIYDDGEEEVAISKPKQKKKCLIGEMIERKIKIDCVD